MNQSQRPHFYTKPLRDQVYDFLKAELESGHLTPGAIIKIRKLSEELGVSRTTLKDALLALQAKGFVSFLPQKGVMINKLSTEEIEQIFQIIGALEGSVVLIENAAIDRVLTDRLSDINDKILRAIKAREPEGYWQYNRLFHNTLIGISRNAKLLEVADDLRKRLYDFPVPEKFNFEWSARCTEEHSRIIKFLSCKEYEKAAIFMQKIHWSFHHQGTFVNGVFFDS